jgi:hypothetical protein
VPQMATRAVITSIFVCLLLNVLCILITPASAWEMG